MTEHQLRTLKAAHDHAVLLGAECPDDCVFRTAQKDDTVTAVHEAETWYRVGDVRGPGHGHTVPTMEASMTIDPYAEPLKQMRAAAATPESTFEVRWKAERLAALAAEQQRRDAERHEPRFVAAEDLAKYRAPDSYAAALKALREKDAN